MIYTFLKGDAFLAASSLVGVGDETAAVDFILLGSSSFSGLDLFIGCLSCKQAVMICSCNSLI